MVVVYLQCDKLKTVLVYSVKKMWLKMYDLIKNFNNTSQLLIEYQKK